MARTRGAVVPHLAPEIGRQRDISEHSITKPFGNGRTLGRWTVRCVDKQTRPFIGYRQSTIASFREGRSNFIKTNAGVDWIPSANDLHKRAADQLIVRYLHSDVPSRSLLKPEHHHLVPTRLVIPCHDGASPERREAQHGSNGTINTART